MTNKKPKILVVDDKDFNLQLLESMLISLGYYVMLAQDGVMAIKLVKKTPPDVILLDVIMPKINGFEVARLLKENNETSRIPIVMVTSLQEVKDCVKAIEVGADDFLTKSFDEEMGGGQGNPDPLVLSVVALSVPRVSKCYSKLLRNNTTYSVSHP